MKKLATFVTAAALTLAMAVPAFARSYDYTAQGWSVTFTADRVMDENFDSNSFYDFTRGMQPGDDSSYRVSITNAYPSSTDWYMTNEILTSLEDYSSNAATNGGAYSYRLTYTNSQTGETTTLFDSTAVGGDVVTVAGEGLKTIGEGRSEYFLIDTLEQGESGYVDLYVMLDGETQMNAYQDTLAQLSVNFAVELPDSTTPETTPETTPPGQTVKTGDSSTPMLYFGLLAASGLILLILAFMKLKKDRSSKEGE